MLLRRWVWGSMLGCVSLWAQTTEHYFQVENGLIEYEVLGGAQLTKETNLNIQGTSRLRFKKWGDIRQEEDEGIVVTRGAINDVQEVKRLEKHESGKVIIVDYDNEQLLEHKQSDDKTSFEKETEGLLHRGQDVVAGILCAMWVGPSVKKCIYKGVVLKQESHVLGVSYVKKARKAVFDINETDEQCAMPDYPIQDFGLFKDNIKTKNQMHAENICKIFKNVVTEVDAKDKSFEPQKVIDSKKRKKFVNKISEGIFIKQQEVLPELLMAMKKSRECLQLSQDQFERQSCVSTYRATKKELGIHADDYGVFKEETQKDKLVDRIEDAIIDFQPRMPCIKRAQNFIDISSCMN